MNNKFIEEELKIFKYLFFCFSEKNKKITKSFFHILIVLIFLFCSNHFHIT